MNVSIESAYAEACRALGESMVRERLLSSALNDANEALDASHAEASGDDPAAAE